MENKENVTAPAAPVAAAQPAQRPFRPVQRRKKKVCIFCQDKIDHIDYKDIAKLYKEQAMLGFSKVLAPVALGQSQTAVIAAAKFENQIMHLNEVFIPPQMSSTISAGAISASANKGTASNSGAKAASSGEVGRPELDDSEKSDKTLKNRESMS